MIPLRTEVGDLVSDYEASLVTTQPIWQSKYYSKQVLYEIGVSVHAVIVTDMVNQEEYVVATYIHTHMQWGKGELSLCRYIHTYICTNSTYAGDTVTTSLQDVVALWAFDGRTYLLKINPPLSNNIAMSFMTLCYWGMWLYLCVDGGGEPHTHYRSLRYGLLTHCLCVMHISVHFFIRMYVVCMSPWHAAKAETPLEAYPLLQMSNMGNWLKQPYIYVNGW